MPLSICPIHPKIWFSFFIFFILFFIHPFVHSLGLILFVLKKKILDKLKFPILKIMKPVFFYRRHRLKIKKE